MAMRGRKPILYVANLENPQMEPKKNELQNLTSIE